MGFGLGLGLRDELLEGDLVRHRDHIGRVLVDLLGVDLLRVRVKVGARVRVGVRVRVRDRVRFMDRVRVRHY